MAVSWNIGPMQVYFGEGAAHVDQVNVILNSNFKEAWGETKSVLGSRGETERTVTGEGEGKEKFSPILNTTSVPGVLFPSNVRSENDCWASTFHMSDKIYEAK